ncbi:hypothetical protein [Candidatus Viridilinea mediisalina]|uniref:DUF2281 domain-containing protein n=1 Tax=Candidatus Viridilinea mediisalina TaxID=2024553 RepID=A0A2A6RF50_9CHLR|nr:hypothetical protein [Candidatus Viridilinea mediisalina]PDW01707.1 hypothetical protein CJ255_17775 [Candidatus Viridilinea mediisalina]
MTTTYETAVTLIDQLSPIDQARLMALLAERIQQTLQPRPAPCLAPPSNDDPPFWHTPIDHGMPRDERLASPTSPPAAIPDAQAMVTRWFGEPLTEEDARELALDRTLAEWNS